MLEVCLEHNNIRGHKDWRKAKRPVLRIVFRINKPVTEVTCPDCRVIQRIYALMK